MMFRIRDCEKRILSLYYQKISNELSRSPGHENIRAELAIARPNELPTAIKGHREWDKDNISYKLDHSHHLLRLSIRNASQQEILSRFHVALLLVQEQILN
jgi:hypothetical protein